MSPQRQMFKMRINQGDADIATILDGLTDGDASEFVKNAIRDRVGIPTSESRLAKIETKLEELLTLLKEVMQKLGGLK